MKTPTVVRILDGEFVEVPVAPPAPVLPLSKRVEAQVAERMRAFFGDGVTVDVIVEPSRPTGSMWWCEVTSTGKEPRTFTASAGSLEALAAFLGVRP